MEYVVAQRELYKTNQKAAKKYGVFFIAPSMIKNQEEMEKEISDNTLKLVNDNRTFVVDIHASKNRIMVEDPCITPARFLVHKKLG